LANLVPSLISVFTASQIIKVYLEIEFPTMVSLPLRMQILLKKFLVAG